MNICYNFFLYLFSPSLIFFEKLLIISFHLKKLLDFFFVEPGFKKIITNKYNALKSFFFLVIENPAGLVCY